jgi:hypothetical protein
MAVSSYWFCGLYFNSTIDSIYVGYNLYTGIYVFNFNLVYTDTFGTGLYFPISINGYNNQLYVGTSNGTILVIVNRQIIKQFNGCNGQNINLNSILFDQFDNIGAACYITSPLYLFKTNGTYLNKNIPTLYYSSHIGFDSKLRLVAVTNNLILFYN